MISDLSKNYALIIDYSDVDAGFVYLNGERIAGRYDFPEGGQFVQQIEVLGSNTLEASFLASAEATFKVQEMSLSGMEDAPPILSVGELEVVQGETGPQNISVTDLGSTEHSYSILEQASHGDAEISVSGELRYTANPTYEGYDFVIIRVENSNELAQLIRAMITVSVSEVSGNGQGEVK